jgi:hypothetical protein
MLKQICQKGCLILILLCGMVSSIIAQDTTGFKPIPPILRYEPSPVVGMTYRLGNDAIRPRKVYEHLKTYNPQAARDFHSYRVMKATSYLCLAGSLGLMIPELNRTSSFETNKNGVAVRAWRFSVCSLQLS